MSPLAHGHAPRGSVGRASPPPGLVAASRPIQRPDDARLLAIDAHGALSLHARRDWISLLAPGDLVVANDAATLPASLRARHLPSGRPLELRLAGRASLAPTDLVFDAVLFGEGDHRTRTEDRAAPPAVRAGDVLALEGSALGARVVALLDHPRLVRVDLGPDASRFWSELARLGRPVQYAHVPERLALWDVWTILAGPPVAFEPPSAGFVLDWASVTALEPRGVRLATLTHAAGLSSTGDPTLDARLPLDEPYRIPARTGALIDETRRRGGRVVAIGTTVVRALEHASASAPLTGAIVGVADQRIGASTLLSAVDVIVSGTHEPGTSHRELLRAFTDDATLVRADGVLAEERFRTHEFGDSVWIARSRTRSAHSA